MNKPNYKRGTIRKDGKLYGRYPDGSLFRIYSTTDRSFSWWTWMARRFFAYAKPPSRATPIAHAQEPPTSVIRHRL